MSRRKIPPHPPRKREESRWQQPQWLFLIAGGVLIIVGLLGIYGPLAADFGGPASDEDDGSIDGPADASSDVSPAESSGTDVTAASDDTSDTSEMNDIGGRDNTRNESLHTTIGDLFRGDTDSERTRDNKTREKCVVD